MESVCTPRSKLPDVGVTIFTVIGQLAARHDALDLSQGAPNFQCDPKLVDGAWRAMRAGQSICADGRYGAGGRSARRQSGAASTFGRGRR